MPGSAGADTPRVRVRADHLPRPTRTRAPLASLACMAVAMACMVTTFAAPASAATDTSVVQLAAGEAHSLALRADGRIVSWGRNDHGQLGTGTDDWRLGGSMQIATTGSFVLRDDTGQPLDDVVSIAGGAQCPIAIRADGTAWSWGSVACAPSDTWPGSVDRTRAVQVRRFDGTPLTNVVAVAGGEDVGVAVLVDGTVWSWGSSSLGTGMPAEGLARQVLTAPGVPLTDVVEVAGRTQRVLARTSLGAVWSWSTGFAVEEEESPGVPFANVEHVTVGADHAGVLISGLAFMWGTGTSGQLGHGLPTDQTYSTNVKAGEGGILGDVLEMEAGNDFSVARTSDGNIYVWGALNGSAAADNLNLPDGLVADEIAAGGSHALARSGGRVFAVGSNWAGQLADPAGTDTSWWVPVNVEPHPTTAAGVVQDDGAAVAAGGVVSRGSVVGLRVDVRDDDPDQELQVWAELVSATEPFSATCGVASPTTHQAAAPLATGGTHVSATVNVSGLVDGVTYRWRACAVDPFGATSGWVAGGTFGYDSAAPVVSAVTSSTDTVQRLAHFAVTAADVGFGLHAQPYSFDGGATWQDSPTATIALAKYDVPQHVQVVVRDQYGHATAALDRSAVLLDSVPPTIGLDRSLLGRSPQRDTKIAVADFESGLATIRATFAGRTARVRGAHVLLDDLPEGRGMLVVVATDESGNSSTWQRRLVVDRTAPTVARTSGVFVLGPNHRLTSRDGISGVSGAAPRVLAPKLGANVVKASVSDRVGNRASRRLVLYRRLSLAAPQLNADVRLRVGDRRLLADGSLIGASFRYLGSTAPWYAHEPEGAALVREAQWRLQKLGFLSPVHKRRGELDLTTIRAVQRYQASRGIETLGTIGPKTRRALDREVTSGRIAPTLRRR